jgi:hypothetical protein
MSDNDKNETITSLLHTIALIRESAAINEKPMLSELPDVIRKLREERDEARRRVCEMSLQIGKVFRRIEGKTVEVMTPEGCAEIMRWDCFKEVKP